MSYSDLSLSDSSPDSFDSSSPISPDSDTNDLLLSLDTVKISHLETYYAKSFYKFYYSCSKSQIDSIIAILTSSSKISLRILDWFVTRYCKVNTVYIESNNSLDDQNVINVYISYKAQLKTFSKQYFDPFKRRNVIMFKFPFYHDKIKTTYGQLNFFKWLLENNILSFIESHYDDLSDKMYLNNINDKKKKVEKHLKKNHDSFNSNFNTNDIIYHKDHITICFN